MEARGDLAVRGPPEGAGVLPRHTDRVSSLLGEPGVIEDERLDLRQLILDLPREPSADLVVGPRADRHALLQSLAHRLDAGRLVDQPRRLRLDALAGTVEQQPFEIPGHRAPPLRPAHAVEQRTRKRFQQTVELLHVGDQPTVDHGRRSPARK